MAHGNCNYPVIGRFLAVGIFIADDCGIPLEGTNMGWVDQCPAALSMEDDIQEGDGFTRTCANGEILVDLPPEQTFAGIDVNLDLHGADPEFMAAVGGATPVIEGGSTVGWDDCKDSKGSASFYLWREIVGAGACDPAAGGAQYLLTIIPWVDQLRVVTEGTFGGDDGFLRLTGRARDGHGFGLGAFPYLDDGAGGAACPTQPVDSNCLRRNVITTLPPPEDCGFVDVVSCNVTSP